MSQAELKFYNTKSRKLEVFKSINRGQVGLYCCGPTVYNYQHIGNLRTYIFEDLLSRSLRYAGYKVNHVMNITDVGHLVSDADEGEDKMLLASKREAKSSHDIASYYTDIFFEHCSWLNITRPDVICKATDHIAEMISLIEKLQLQDIAYESGGNVYFDVNKFPDYSKLALLDLEQLRSGARIEVDSKKRNPYDFALWFTKSKFEDQELQWDSPWGRGYPGWHIECSAMAHKYLGESFDIHCGGIDHIPVHHTNEIAQSEAAHGKPMANFWLHGGFLVADKQKMSKSTGEFLTLDRLKDKGFDPISYRLLCLGGSYRKELAWSWEALESASARLNGLREKIMSLNESLGGKIPSDDSSLSAQARTIGDQFKTEVLNDIGVSRGLANFQQTLQNSTIEPGEKLYLALDFDKVLGLGVSDWLETKTETVPKKVKDLLAKREEARSAKDWAKSDTLRDELLAEGWTVKDTPEGPTIKKT